MANRKRKPIPRKGRRRLFVPRKTRKTYTNKKNDGNSASQPAKQQAADSDFPHENVELSSGASHLDSSANVNHGSDSAGIHIISSLKSETAAHGIHSAQLNCDSDDETLLSETGDSQENLTIPVGHFVIITQSETDHDGDDSSAIDILTDDERCSSAGAVDDLEGRSLCDRLSVTEPVQPLPSGSGIDTTGVDDSSVQLESADPIHFVAQRVRKRLPKNWILVTNPQGIQVGLTAHTELLVIQRSAFFAVDGRIIAGVHGKSLPSTHIFWQEVRQIPLTSDTAMDFIENVLLVVTLLRSQEVCKGVEMFQHLWEKASDCYIDSNPYYEYRYTETCRSKSCALLVSGFRIKRCEACNKVCQCLRERSRTQSSEQKTSTPSKFTAHKNLNTPEKIKRMQQASIEMHKIKKANRDLRQQLDKFKKLTRTEGMLASVLEFCQLQDKSCGVVNISE